MATTLQMLCSLATLIHDSYLPVYIQDELGLSNTKVWVCAQWQ
jgi:biotin operon repressor